MEFPHLMQLIKYNQFDTIYHEHFSYLSFYTVKQIFEFVGLKLFDVEAVSTHGGSLRIYATHQENTDQKISSGVQLMLNKELAAGVNKIETYKGFQEKALKIKMLLLDF